MNKEYNTVYSRKHKLHKGLKSLFTKRPVLFSSEDLDRMYLERSKAGLSSRLQNTNQEMPVRDFSSYFHCSKNGYTPKYLVTSHAASAVVPNRKTVCPSCFNVIQYNVQWNPHLRSNSVSTENSDSDLTNHMNINSRCGTCKICKKLERIDSKNSLKLNDPHTNFTSKDLDFMTPNNNNGKRIVTSSYYKSRCKILNPNIVRNDGTNSKDFRSKDFPSHECAINLDKKAQVPDNVIKERSCFPDAVEYRKPRRCWSVKSFLRMSRTKINEDMNTIGEVQQTFRRILYNEGIDDSIAYNFPMILHRHPSPEPTEKKSSRYLVTDGLIPCDHRRKSRYHYHCQEELNKKCYKLDNNFKYNACVAEYHKDPSPERIPLVLYRFP